MEEEFKITEEKKIINPFEKQKKRKREQQRLLKKALATSTGSEEFKINEKSN